VAARIDRLEGISALGR